MSRRIKRRNEPPAKPRAYWTIVGIGLRSADEKALDAAVEHCRANGLYRMNRSRLVRIALARLDLDAVINGEAGVRR